MAKKKVTYDVFVRVVVPESIDPSKIEAILHNAASGQGWDFSCSVTQEDDPAQWFEERILLDELDD